ncbi:RNA polymerase sigma factor [bacterium]|nr:RNA polymerase sigma factor [bacterium]MBU1072376.1 RNA polymerase sigma factor [bacterium]MBU1676889.1 RNA polymerase sigma factor [bacterium]
MKTPDAARGPGRDRDRSDVPSRETLRRVRARDPEALAALFEYGFDRIYGLAARMLGNREQAQDVIQEVFLRVHRSAHRLDAEREPLPWLRQITVNLCRDLWRSAGARGDRQTVSLDEHADLGATLPSDAAPTDAAVLATERERLVQHALGELPPQLREVVLLRDYETLEHDQIAALVGASGAAVRKRYSRALARLSELLEGELR